MKKIERNELLDLASYEADRERMRVSIIERKKHRRIPLGQDMTLTFENRDTMLVQIHEMLRTERITRESAIIHELTTYNELIPDRDELSATLMIEYVDKQERASMLEVLHDLPGRIQLRVGDRHYAAEFLANDGEEPGRLPAVNYLRFRVGPGAVDLIRNASVAVALECTHSAYPASTPLGAGPRRELAADLESA